MSEPQFTKVQTAFSLACAVAINISASPAAIWKLLTDAQAFPRWNSTVTGIEGDIREGQKLRIRVPGSSQTFSPTVSGVVPNQRMIWTGGFAPIFKGVRTFELTSRADGSADFAMHETFAGLMLPLIKRSLPDFKPVFERYASDLKIEAERSKP